MAHSLDELTVNWEEDGELKVRELKRHVLSEHGSWATVLFLFEERAADGFRPPKVQIRRYQKRKGGWIFHSKFVLPSAEQAREAAETILSWLPAP
jgi:hypothetical protein